MQTLRTTFWHFNTEKRNALQWPMQCIDFAHAPHCLCHRTALSLLF